MGRYSDCFRELYGKFTTWTWQELLFGIKNNIVDSEDIKDLTYDVISEDNANYDLMLQILIAESDEIEAIVKELALKEKKQNAYDIISKWIFTIIYHHYIKKTDSLYTVIDDTYCEFNYPSEISNLVSYMPQEDGLLRDDALKEYIKKGEGIWLV